MRFKYVMSEVMVGLWRNVTMTIAMIITLAVSLTMLGASALMYRQVDKMKEFYFARVEVTIFLTNDVTEAQRTALSSALDSDPLVQDVHYESKAEAYTRFKEIFADAPDLVSAVKPDGLPESFRVKLVDAEQFQEISTRYQDTEGIDEIVDQRETLAKIFSILGSLQTLSLVVASVMAVAALLLVGNTIQVAAYSKRREVAVMKLVGASNWFIQAPFVLEAVVAGLLGSIIAFGVIVLGKVFLVDGSLSSLTQLLLPVAWTDVLLTLPLMAVVGGGISAITGWITLRFYLRV